MRVDTVSKQVKRLGSNTRCNCTTTLNNKRCKKIKRRWQRATLNNKRCKKIRNKCNDHENADNNKAAETMATNKPNAATLKNAVTIMLQRKHAATLNNKKSDMKTQRNEQTLQRTLQLHMLHDE